MSPCLNNLLTALRAMSAVKTAPNLIKSEFFQQLDNLTSLDAARIDYYTDEHSRRVFDWVQQYMAVLSFYQPPIPLQLDNTPFPNEEWAQLEEQATKMTPYITDDYLLDRIDTWILEAYSLKGECEALPGDIVLDCGTYTGNTSLYFSQKVGASGHVYGFEAANATFAKYLRNMRGVKNVTPIHAAVGNTTGVLRFSDNTIGAHIAADGEEVPAITLDEFCRSHNLTKVDFIKMDVEGAEGIALDGAAAVIRKHRPKMAISAYHKLLDVISLPARILSIAPYTFRLRHFSNTMWETVLYCIPGTTHGMSSPSQPKAAGSLKQYTMLFSLLSPLMRRASHAYDLQVHDMLKALEAATQTIHQLIDDNKRLGVENVAFRKMLEKFGMKSTI